MITNENAPPETLVRVIREHVLLPLGKIYKVIDYSGRRLVHVEPLTPQVNQTEKMWFADRFEPLG